MLDRALIAALTLVTGAVGHAVPPSPVMPGVSDTKLLGQRIMVGIGAGTRPDGELLRSVRAGRVGSIILFGVNIASGPQLLAATSALQRAARAGGNPPLLIATDQEGGQVKRIPSAPPTLSPSEIAARRSTAVAFAQGRATGRYLKRHGINMNLAPVADVPTSPNAFIWREGRAFSFSAAQVAKYSTAFALGLQRAGTAAAAKHFPGVGSATLDTDNQREELYPTRAQRDGALKPYQSLIRGGVDAVQLSAAGFPAYDRTGTPTAISRTIIQGVLRKRLGFTGVAVTDALRVLFGHDEISAGVLAARAGADILLYADQAPGELSALHHALNTGALNTAEARASYERILALKHKVAGG